jgi:hypothetical protein
MNRVLTIAATVAAFALLASSAALAGGGPVTKQNGKSPAFAAFTSICSVAPFANYGFCSSGTTTFTGVNGKINAVQSKPGRYNLGVSLDGLMPGALYRLWGNRDGLAVPGNITGFFEIATAQADAGGHVDFEYQTTEPEKLAFDVNQLSNPNDEHGITVATSYWSKQFLHVNPDSTLSAG